MEKPPPEDIKAILKTIHTESRKYVAQIYWGRDRFDSTTVLNNGSCFAVKTADGVFGVTAHHVIDAFKEACKVTPAPHLMIRNTEISEWGSREIAGDHALDILTFRLTPEEIQQIGLSPFEWKTWPPPSPQIGRGVLFVGYAGIDRRVLSKTTIEFLQTSNVATLKSCDSENLEIQIEKKDLISISGEEIPSLLKDLGGFSGAPVLVISQRLTELFWLGGIILKQVAARREEGPVTFIARRLGRINSDGSLNTTAR